MTRRKRGVATPKPLDPRLAKAAIELERFLIPPPGVTVRDAANRFGVSMATIRRWVSSGLLTADREGRGAYLVHGRIRVPLSTIESIVDGIGLRTGTYGWDGDAVLHVLRGFGCVKLGPFTTANELMLGLEDLIVIADEQETRSAAA